MRQPSWMRSISRTFRLRDMTCCFLSYSHFLGFGLSKSSIAKLPVVFVMAHETKSFDDGRFPRMSGFCCLPGRT
ncbi:hypothetical protein BRAS3843_1310045 [Bradyrhizobium sp. STM 3843]|nr:hypothetical protein BRAS3843_1310045 [Bradyrhizobium sp. STM 3843]